MLVVECERGLTIKTYTIRPKYKGLFWRLGIVALIILVLLSFIHPLYKIVKGTARFRGRIEKLVSEKAPVLLFMEAFGRYKAVYSSADEIPVYEIPDWIRSKCTCNHGERYKIYLYNCEGLPPFNVVVISDEGTGKTIGAFFFGSQ